MARGIVIGGVTGFLLGALWVLVATQLQPAGHHPELQFPWDLLFTAGPLLFFGGLVGGAVGARRDARHNGTAATERTLIMRRVAFGMLFSLGLIVLFELTTNFL